MRQCQLPGQQPSSHAACDDLVARGTPLSGVRLAQLDRVDEPHPVVLTVLEEASTGRCALAALPAVGGADLLVVRIGMADARSSTSLLVKLRVSVVVFVMAR